MKKTLTLLFIAVISALVLFELAALLKHKSIEQRFIEELIAVKSNAGDVLEVGTLNSAASLSQEEKIDFTLLPAVNIPFNTKVSIRVPVTYRFHILLSEKWRIQERGDSILVTAPSIHASQPPAPDMSAAQLITDGSIYPGLTAEAQKRLQELITPNLKLNAAKYANSEVVRDSSRKSVEKFLQSRFSCLAEDLKRKQLVVRFDGEI